LRYYFARRTIGFDHPPIGLVKPGTNPGFFYFKNILKKISKTFGELIVLIIFDLSNNNQKQIT
jgi:hypothetical protein